MRCISVVMCLCFKIFPASFLTRFCLLKFQCLLIDSIIIIIIIITVILISLAFRAVVPITFIYACSKLLTYVIFNYRMFRHTQRLFNVTNSQHVSATTATIRPVSSLTDSGMSLHVLGNH